jgi:hypothetical protein
MVSGRWQSLVLVGPMPPEPVTDRLQLEEGGPGPWKRRVGEKRRQCPVDAAASLQLVS